MAADDLFEALRHLPDQVRDATVAAADVEGLPGPGEVAAVVIVGAGGGGVAGDVVESVAHLQGSVPVLATGGISPSWLSESSLVVAVSQSGDDQPTVAAARIAQASGARMVAVTSGGELMELASSWGVPVVRVDRFAGPAAGLGVVIVPILVLLERVGALSGMSRSISQCAEQIEIRQRLIDDAPAPVEKLADGVQGRMAVVSGAGGVGKHAARRWVHRLDRVGGVSSVRRNLPADEDEAASWATLARRVPDGVAAVVLRHDFEPPGLADRIDLLGGAVTALYEVRAEGEGAMAQLLDLVLVGDAVAELAARRGPSGP
jgi:glucose/mannose-6-phosphate isomerase